MSAATLEESRNLALELYALLRDLDAAVFRAELEAAVRARLASAEARVTALLRRASEASAASSPSTAAAAPPSAVTARLAELAPVLREFAPEAAPAARAPALRADWRELRRRLQPAYEALAAALHTEAVHVPRLRPTNYKRNVFHVGAALFALALIEFVFAARGLIVAAAGFALFAWTCEATRPLSARWNALLMRFFAPIAHPHETFRINSATWYITALLALALMRAPLLAAVAVAVLGAADPVAALIGRRFGRVRLMHGRTLEGSLAFFVAGTLAAFAVLRVFHRAAAPSALVALGVAAIAGLAGAVAELVSSRVDDNLSVPLVSAGGAALGAALLGVAL